jgi:hypothetical protein
MGVPESIATDAVPDEETAVQIGTGFLRERFGQALLDRNGEFCANLYEEDWLVVPSWRASRVTSRPDGSQVLEWAHGPHPMVIVGKADGCLIKIGHER